MKNINIKGAILHNLKNIDISVPRNKIVAITGISGSGKSTLAFDIIFEEGRKQYLQSLGIVSGLEDEEKCESISGLAPAVAVKQNIIRQSNPRTTVGSRTKILNLLYLVFAAEGTTICSVCGNEVSGDLECENCNTVEERLLPVYFSHNNANGMCMHCSGKGVVYEINFENIVPNDKITLRQVCQNVGVTTGLVNVLARNFKNYIDQPFNSLPDDVKSDVIYGHYTTGNYQKRSFCLSRFFEGKLMKGEDLSGIYDLLECPECSGYRVGEEARRVKIGGKHIGELSTIAISELKNILTELQNSFKSRQSKNVVKEILQKSESLIKTGLGHLSLYRGIPTLSGGEIQRLFLNSHIESQMDSVIYVLDEPTSGLHESEKDELIKFILKLKELGNTVLLVEHDRKMIQIADHIIDIGPKAGNNGGEIVYQGDLDGIYKCRKSLTAKYLSGEFLKPVRERINYNSQNEYLEIVNANTNNLKNVSVKIPLGGLIGVAGVSGSGKSSLISDTLIPLLGRHFTRLRTIDRTDDGVDIEGDVSFVKTVADKLIGVENISGYSEVLQDPIGRNINSNPASYTGVWDKIRKLFAKQPDATKLNLSAGDFSFNSKGACSKCGGSGREKIWMGGDTFFYNTCKECDGKRFNDITLSVKYKGKSIFDILEMSVSESVTLFSEEKPILKVLNALDKIGMGYIRLGQPTPTLSGGEAQRIKLAKETGRIKKANTIYILDEPTTGLSRYDTVLLIKQLDELVQNGNTVIIIEHDTDVLSVCDYIIELGPEGGERGGGVIAEGSPEELKRNPNSITGKYL